jgi:hypothetical protein
MRFIKKLLIFTIFIIILLVTLSPATISNPSFQSTDISQLPYKQEIIIPIDTSLENSKYQPIDIRVEFEENCWAENETIHSVRIAYDDKTDLIEIDSQIYDLSHTDENHIDECSIVFLIPNEATGEEKYYVLYNNQPTDPPEYEDHISLLDTHYYYEPISGQVMDFDYYQIIQDEYIIYGLCQNGELLGNGMSNSVIKLIDNSKEFKTKNADQIASFYMSYSIEPSGEFTGSMWAEDITKTILVDGNLMTRINIIGTSPNGAIKTDNIYTYYYSPTDTKRINVNINHQVLEDIEVKGTKEREGIYCSISTIKARSATIEDMNLGEIMPKVHFFSEDETIISYDIPPDPDADPAEWLLSANDDQDVGSKSWLCIDDPSKGIAHGLIFDKNLGYIDGENDGIQIKTSVKQHVKLPGLEADTGDLFAIRNAYEDGSHNTHLDQGLNVKFNVEYMAVTTGGYDAIDKESELFQNLINDRPINRGDTTSEDTEEEIERYTLSTVVHLAPSFPLGSLLSAATGKNRSYLTAELYKENVFASSGSVQRLQIGSIDFDLDDTTFSEKIKIISNIFDLKNRGSLI